MSRSLMRNDNLDRELSWFIKSTTEYFNQTDSYREATRQSIAKLSRKIARSKDDTVVLTREEAEELETLLWDWNLSPSSIRLTVSWMTDALTETKEDRYWRATVKLYNIIRKIH